MDSTIGSRISHLIEALGLNKSKFAAKIGISPASVSTICSGKNGVSGQTVKVICSVFDVSEKWLLDGEGEMFAKRSSYDDIADFVAVLSKKEPDDFQVRLISALARLSPEKWYMVEEIFDDIAQHREK